MKVVHPGIPARSSNAQRTRVEQNGHVLTYIGPLKRYKGVNTAIRALPLVLSLFPDARLQVAGRGYLEPELGGWPVWKEWRARSLSMGS